MEELIKWLTDNGFQIDLPPLDGKIHRFDRDGKKNAWFWGVKMHATKSGQEYVIAKVGDWKTDEEFDFRSNVAFTREDKKIIASRVKESQEKAAAAKEALHADAADMAAGIFAGARLPGPTGYMKRKLIAELYGARITKQGSIDAVTGRKAGRMALEDVLVVPMRDVNGKLWGIQQVTDRGDKYFITGQKKQGCFHLIPDDADLLSTDPVYICEGFATGASIHQATNGTVVVAFDAGNLLPVARAIRAEAPDKPMLICADDDQWGRRPDGSPYNAGREQGEKAGAETLARVVFPRFRSEEGRPSDWNDLHVAEGIDEVKRQLLEVKAERHYVRCLGHRDGAYFYTSSGNREIVSIQKHVQSDLLNLMPLSYWETLYPGKKGIDWARAADELMRRCRDRGIFWPENIRGTGVWEDAGRIVVHLGDRLYVDGQEIGIHDLPSQFIYQLSSPTRSVHPRPLTLEECMPIHRLMGLASFERSEQRFFLAGWIMAARLSGLLEWRPHIWITGESGSGKSTILQKFVFPMLGDQKKRFTGGTTEPGMRQAIKSNALPVVFDEFEPDSPEAVQAVKSCIQFIRQASTDSGDIVKGSIGGDSIQYKARFCAVVSAIKTLLSTQADRSRFTLVELKKVHNDPKQWQEVQAALSVFSAEYADRYFARLLAMLPAIRKNMEAFEMAFAEKHSQRLGQQYGPLLAGWAAITADGALTEQEIAELVDQVDLSQEGAASGETDQEDCLSHLLQRQVRLSTRDGVSEDMTVGAAVQAAQMNERFNEELARYGIRLVRSTTLPGGSGLFVAVRNPQLTGLFRDTSWVAGWTSSLGRLPGAVRNKVLKFDGHAVRGTLIPIGSIFATEGQSAFGL